jgi:hypothetical protein
MQRLNQEIDRETRDQKAFPEMVALQSTFGNSYPVVAHGKLLVPSMEDGRGGSIYLFSDLLL